MGGSATAERLLAAQALDVLWIGESGAAIDGLLERGLRVERVGLESGLEQVAARAPDVVVLNAGTSASAMELVRALGRQSPGATLPLIVLSDEQSASPRVQRSGLVAWLRTGASSEELASTLQAQLLTLSAGASEWPLAVSLSGLDEWLVLAAESGVCGLVLAEEPPRMLVLGPEGRCIPAPEAFREGLASAPDVSLRFRQLPATRVQVVTDPLMADQVLDLPDVSMAVVHDDPSTRALWADYMEAAGAEVHACDGSEDALSTLGDVNPALLVIDEGALAALARTGVARGERLPSTSLLVVSRASTEELDPHALVAEAARLLNTEERVRERLADADVLVERVESLGAARWLTEVGHCDKPLELLMRGPEGTARVRLEGGEVRESSYTPHGAGGEQVRGPAAMQALLQIRFGRVLVGPHEQVEAANENDPRPAQVAPLPEMAESPNVAKRPESFVRRAEQAVTRPPEPTPGGGFRPKLPAVRAKLDSIALDLESAPPPSNEVIHAVDVAAPASTQERGTADAAGAPVKAGSAERSAPAVTRPPEPTPAAGFRPKLPAVRAKLDSIALDLESAPPPAVEPTVADEATTAPSEGPSSVQAGTELPAPPSQRADEAALLDASAAEPSRASEQDSVEEREQALEESTVRSSEQGVIRPPAQTPVGGFRPRLPAERATLDSIALDSAPPSSVDAASTAGVDGTAQDSPATGVSSQEASSSVEQHSAPPPTVEATGASSADDADREWENDEPTQVFDAKRLRAERNTSEPQSEASPREDRRRERDGSPDESAPVLEKKPSPADERPAPSISRPARSAGRPHLELVRGPSVPLSEKPRRSSGVKPSAPLQQAPVVQPPDASMEKTPHLGFAVDAPASVRAEQRSGARPATMAVGALALVALLAFAIWSMSSTRPGDEVSRAAAFEEAASPAQVSEPIAPAAEPLPNEVENNNAAPLDTESEPSDPEPLHAEESSDVASPDTAGEESDAPERFEPPPEGEAEAVVEPREPTPVQAADATEARGTPVAGAEGEVAAEGSPVPSESSGGLELPSRLRPRGEPTPAQQLMIEAFWKRAAKDYDAAEHLLMQAQRLEPRNPEVAYQLALNYVRQLKHADALRWARRAAELGPADPAPVSLQGDILYQRGRFVPARDAWRRCLEVRAGYIPCATRLQRVEQRLRRFPVK